MANVSSGPRGTGTGRGQIFSAPDAAQDGKWCPAGLGSQWAQNFSKKRLKQNKIGKKRPMVSHWPGWPAL